MRRITLILASGLVALLGTGAAQAANPVVSAVERSADARSSVVDIQVSTSAKGSTVVLTGTGTVRGKEAKLTMRTSAAGQRLVMDLIMLREAGGYVMYMRSPSLRSQLPAGKSWLKFDLQKAVARLGIDFSSLLESSQTLAPLEQGLVSTTRVGSDRVAGKPTTHYRAVVDVHRAAAAVPAYGKQVAAIERAVGIRLGRVSQEVWVGTDGRVRRLRSSTPTVVQGAKATTVQTLTYRAYDVPVTISAPPLAQVFDFS